jgi:hypothetical protein
LIAALLLSLGLWVVTIWLVVSLLSRFGRHSCWWPLGLTPNARITLEDHQILLGRELDYLGGEASPWSHVLRGVPRASGFR